MIPRPGGSASPMADPFNRLMMRRVLMTPDWNKVGRPRLWRGHRQGVG